MNNKWVIILLVAVILVVSFVMLFTKVVQIIPEKSEGSSSSDHSTDEILDEIDQNLIDESEEISIGEIIY
ncbi:MAG: hypothetical protein QXS02_04615 [Candidatus Thermoplasmatota archaeon]